MRQAFNLAVVLLLGYLMADRALTGSMAMVIIRKIP